MKLKVFVDKYIGRGGDLCSRLSTELVKIQGWRPNLLERLDSIGLLTQLEDDLQLTYP